MNSTCEFPETFPIGTKFKTLRKNPQLCEIVDILRTYNSRGELVKQRYVADHEFLGQKVTAYDVLDIEVRRGLIS